MSQSTLFDDAAATVARVDGEERALLAERVQAWKDGACVWLAGLEWGEEFTADDLVRDVGLPDNGPARNNVVGAWVSAQAKGRAIVFTGQFRKSARAVGHGNLQRVWRVAA